MTREELKRHWIFIEKFKDGASIQRYEYGGWLDVVDFDYTINCNFRIKPTPKPPQYRPWRPEEVPVGEQVRRKDQSNEQARCMIVGVENFGLIYVSSPAWIKSKFSTLEFFDEWTHSLDQGKTWLPCGVLVAEEDQSF